MTPPTDARPGETTHTLWYCKVCKRTSEHIVFCSCLMRDGDLVRIDATAPPAPLTPPAAREAEGTTELCGAPPYGRKDYACEKPKGHAGPHNARASLQREWWTEDDIASGRNVAAAHPEPTPAPDAALREAAQGLLAAMEAWDVILDCESATDAPVIAAIQSLRAALAQDGGR